MEGKLVLISGATSGIGYYTARKYAEMGADLLFINRNRKKSEDLCRELNDEYGTNCDFLLTDLSSLEDLHMLGDQLRNISRTIDVVIHNAGVYLTKRELTAAGLEKVFVVQYLASFILNIYLMEKLRSQDSARIILVNSEGHRFVPWGLRLDDLNWEKRRYSGLKSYGSAKLAQLLAMQIFYKQLAGSGVTINAMHPGAVKTESGKDNGKLYQWWKKNVIERGFRSAEISAEALYYLGVSEDVKGISSRFFNLTQEEEPSPPAMDREAACELWNISLKLAKIQEKMKEQYVEKCA
jgi:NAD(P)-dependent dehydrogenase (short-subunit alcohol dehydrogenase family)